MEEKEIYKKFEENVRYLRNNISPDDIYLFTEEIIMAAMYFLEKWNEWADLDQECSVNMASRGAIVRILQYLDCRNANQPYKFEFLEYFDEDTVA